MSKNFIYAIEVTLNKIRAVAFSKQVFDFFN